MIQTLKNAFKIKEIRNKILLTILLVIIYRIGCYIPVPGIEASVFSDAVEGNSFMGIMSAITGGALSQGTLFAIGISPYINASIIMQLLTVAIPALERLSKEGEEGKHKIAVITRYVTLGLAVVNAVGILLAFNNESLFDNAMFGAQFTVPTWVLFIIVTIIFVAGSMLTMWIGERITEYGVSNGISMLIFIGIIASAGQAILEVFVNIAETGDFTASGGWDLIVFVLLVVVIFAFITWVDGAERKIKVQYAKQIKGNKMYGGQSTFIPIKVNGSGVLPLIFAFALLSFPTMILSFFPNWSFTAWWTKYMTAEGGHWVGNVVYLFFLTLFIFLFAFFYSQIQFNPAEVSKNIQQNGGFVPGIRPGKETADFLARTVRRITFWGAVFLAIMALLPSTVFQIINSGATDLLNAFSATGMLIVVSVALEFNKALENQIMMRHYKGFLK